MSNKGKVLVIGASGFVALHCIAELLKVVSWSIPQLIYAHPKILDKTLRNNDFLLQHAKNLKLFE